MDKKCVYSLCIFNQDHKRETVLETQRRGENFCFRGKGKGDLRVSAKFTNSRELMTSYLQEVIMIANDYDHHRYIINNLFQKSLADLSTAQYRVPAYFPSRSNCQVH